MSTIAARPRALAIRWNVAWVAAAAIAALVGFEVWAALTGYSLRVIGDLPTSVALVRTMGLHPLQAQHPFFSGQVGVSYHSTPYLQVLALIWHAIAAHPSGFDAIGIGRFLGFVAIPCSLFTLWAVWLYASLLAGRRAATIAVPVLLVVFGPPLVIWTGDLTFNGFLYTGAYPVTFATGLALITLVVVTRRHSLLASVATCPLAALALLDDQFIGLMMVGILTLQACHAATRDRREALRIPLIVTGAFGLALLWPDFSIMTIFRLQGAPVPVVIVGAYLAPWAWLAIMRLRAAALAQRALDRILLAASKPGIETRLAVGGAVVAFALALWQLILIPLYPTGALLYNNHPALYWSSQSGQWRWLLMFATGTVGLIGLARLYREHQPHPLAWFALVYGIGLLGIGGYYAVHLGVPLWYRFLYTGQIPLAVGVGYYLSRPGQPVAQGVTLGLLLFVAAYKIVTLTDLSPTLRFFNTPLQPAWGLSKVLPPGSNGLVASDPSTSYFIPAATDRKVLTVTTGHVDTQQQVNLASAHYLLVHRLYSDSGPEISATVREMWNLGVRYFVLDKYTTLRPPTMQAFRNLQIAVVRPGEVATMQRMTYRLGQMGHLIHNGYEFAVYALSRNAVQHALTSTTTIAPSGAGTIGDLLHVLSAGSDAAAAQAERALWTLGVRVLSIDRWYIAPLSGITAYSGNITSTQSETLNWLYPNCDGSCQTLQTRLGAVSARIYDDSHFIEYRLKPSLVG
ncbi:MAG TPA: hypothetical protein VHX88_09720 [Solirubrobacteraceae bacterium]|jgi:hypothetical protein|nr:hypothetical protein [Solirubrobacteraceae bacterium]